MLKTVFFEVAGSVKQNNNLLGGFRQRNPPVSQSVLGFPQQAVMAVFVNRRCQCKASTLVALSGTLAAD